MKPSELSIDTRNYLLNRVLPKLISFLSLPILLRLINPIFWGEIALLVGLQSLFSGLFSQGKDASIERYFFRLSKKEAKSYSKAYLIRTFLLLSLGLIVVELFFRFNIINFFDLPYGLPLRFALVGSLFLAHQRYLLAILRATKKSKKVLKYTQFIGILTPLSQVLFVYFIIYIRDFNDRMIVSAYFFAQIIILTISNIIIYRYIRKYVENNQKNLKAGTDNISRYSNMAFLFILFSSFINWQDRYYIKYYLTEYDVGLYDAIYRYVDIIGVIIGSFLIALAPILFSKKDTGTKYFRSMEDLIYLTFLIAAGGTFISKIAVEIILPESFHPAVEIVPILAIGLAFASAASITTTIFDVNERKDLNLKGIIFASIVNAFGNIYLVPEYGILGAAFSMLISGIFWFLLILYFAKSFGFSIKNNLLQITFINLLIVTNFLFWEESFIFDLFGILIFIIISIRSIRLTKDIFSFSL